MARQNPSKSGYASQRLVVDGSAMTRSGPSGSVLFWRSVLIVTWLLVVVRSSLALL